MSASSQPSRPRLPDDHILRRLAVAVEPREPCFEGRATLEPSMSAPGSERPRLALLAIFVDVLAGHVPDGPRTPTVDLRVQVTGRLPSTGEVRLAARPLRVGRSLVVSETLLSDAAGQSFARASATFMNRPIPGVGVVQSLPPTGSVDRYEALLEARAVDAVTLEIDPHERLGNGFVGTVQGGVQALLGELAAERVAGRPFEPVDLDIRFLSRLEVGPLRARATSFGADGPGECIGVELVDAGADEKLVSHVTIVTR